MEPMIDPAVVTRETKRWADEIEPDNCAAAPTASIDGEWATATNAPVASVEITPQTTTIAYGIADSLGLRKTSDMTTVASEATQTTEELCYCGQELFAPTEAAQCKNEIQ